MKIALVSPNREDLPEQVIPLGLLYIAGSVPPHHDVALFDLCFEEHPLQHLAESLDSFAPDVIGVNMRNLLGGDYRPSEEIVKWHAAVVRAARERCPDATIVMGGGGFSVLPEELMPRLLPDFGIAGEGEAAFTALLGALERGDDGFTTIPRIFYWAGESPGDQLVATAWSGTYDSFSGVALPDRTLVDPRYYALHGIDSVQTKRGCALRCQFCTYPTIEGRRLRVRDAREVVAEIKLSLRLHPEISHFFIVDAVFNVPPAHAKEVCRALIDAGIDVPWTCYGNPIGFDAELAHLMAQAGCAGVEVGIDTGSERMLKKLQKGFKRKDAVQMREDLRAAGVPMCTTFMLGTPGETMEDVEASLDLAELLDPSAAILVIWTDERESLGPGHGVAFHLREPIMALFRERAADHPRWIMPAIDANFDPAMLDALRQRGLRGPLWQYLDPDVRRKRRRRRRAERPTP